ncbi:MAG: TIGR04086 family membrane protein [Clostridiales bacterium]|nr:TIGR04086 family membrane protein [Clostridiales bacterium]
MNSSDVKNKNKFLSIFSGSVLAITMTIVLILLFAVIIRFTNLDDKFLFPVNQVIKIISIFIGVTIALKKDNSKGFLKGILISLIYFVLSYLIFSLLQKSWSFTLNNLYDLLLTILMGGIVGAIVINIKNR